MVDDVESLASKILYVGDHGQLEPIGKDPGIMRSPDIRLEEIHRQAAQSGIIRLAHHMRRGSHPSRWDDGGATDARAVQVDKLVARNLDRFDAILCGYNKTRKDVNAAIRRFRGFRDDLPEVGERIICLQNDSDLGVYNGQLVTVTHRHLSYEYPKYDIVDEVGNEYFGVPVHPDQFKEEKRIEMWSKGVGLFDFGYCLTTHKSQGSEWDSVAVIEQLARSWDPARWRYTAATRAAKRLEYWLPKGRM
jgi:exodeoxyribonuclease-5